MGSVRLVRLRSAEDRTPLNVRMPVDGAMCRLGLEVDEVVAEVRRCVWAGEWVACVWETATARYGMRPSLGCAGRQWGACERKTGERGSLLHPCPAIAARMASAELAKLSCDGFCLVAPPLRSG